MLIFSYIRGFVRYKSLLFEFVERDVKVRYRRSILGLLWTLLNPLLSMFIMSFVFSNIFKNTIPNFLLYVLTGQTIFNFYSEATSNAMTSILVGSSLIKKIYIPKYLFPLSKIMSCLINLFASFIALMFVMLLTGIKFQPVILLAIAPMLYVTVFAFGMGLILSSIAVFFRDTIHFYGVIMTIWLYLTPLFYPLEILPNNALKFVEINPLTNIIECFRLIVMYGVSPPLLIHLICVINCTIAMIVGLLVFYSSQDKFILHI